MRPPEIVEGPHSPALDAFRMLTSDIALFHRTRDSRDRSMYRTDAYRQSLELIRLADDGNNPQARIEVSEAFGQLWQRDSRLAGSTYWHIAGAHRAAFPGEDLGPVRRMLGVELKRGMVTPTSLPRPQ